MQNENIAACKSATWNSAIHKKSATRKKCNMRRLLPKKVQHENGAVAIKKVQHEKSATWKNITCLCEIRKKCTRIVHYSAQMNNGLSVDGTLYTGQIPPGDVSCSSGFFFFFETFVSPLFLENIKNFCWNVFVTKSRIVYCKLFAIYGRCFKYFFPPFNIGFTISLTDLHAATLEVWIYSKGFTSLPIYDSSTLLYL